MSRSAIRNLSTKTQRIRPGEGPLRLRLGGVLQAREEGFLGVDSIASDSVDYVVDIKKFPWPIDDAVVDTIFIADYMQRLDSSERIAFMNECGRVLKVGAQLIVKVPHWSSMRSVSDPMTKWPPLCEASFVYYNEEWRKNERIDYGITCDFDFGYGFGLDADIQIRNQEYQQQAIKHWNNAAIDLHVTLTRKT
jgi:hypothetical protein